MGFTLPRENRTNGQSRASRSTNRSRRRATSSHSFNSRYETPTASNSSGRWTPVAASPSQGPRRSHHGGVRRLLQQRTRSAIEPDIERERRHVSGDVSIDDTLSEIIMAVSHSRKDVIGCAYYVASEEKLYLMEDIQLGDVEMIDALKLQINPSTIIVSVNADDKLIDLLSVGEDQCNAESDSNSAPVTSGGCNLETTPPSAFKYDPAVQKLLNLGIGSHNPNNLNFSVPGDLYTHEHNGMEDLSEGKGRHVELLQLQGSIAMENHLSVGCAGAVLSYIMKRRASRFLPNDENAQMLFRVVAIELFSTKETMFINRDALHSLQIFHRESHPHSHKQGPTGSTSGSKEGLSVYGLFQHLAWTPQGKMMLRRCFLRPSLSIELINERLDAIGLFVHPENSAPFEDIVRSLKHVVDARKSIANLKKGVSGDLKKPNSLGRSVWYGLKEFAYQIASIEKAVGEIVGFERLSLHDKIKAKFNIPHLASAGQMINNMIDFEESADPSRIVKSGIDDDLDERRRLYDGVDSLLSKVAREISMDIPEGLPANLNVVYFPQIGFLISTPKDSETGRSLWEGTEEDVWQIKFSSENSVYYKNDKMKQMDTCIGDMWNDICDKEIEILHDLSLRILGFEKAFVEASDLCAELDFLVALASGAKKYGLCRPQMSMDNAIDIKQGRHPLQELLVPSFVPNDTYLRGAVVDNCNPVSNPGNQIPSESEMTSSGPTILILTGPNFSGKSVYLKQVSLIVYLAHVGSFVPAERAKIGLTDKILTRVTTRESVSASSSTFTLDLQQMSLALKLATPRSLLIIDEFGKGTGAADGAGLFAGVIKDLLGSAEDVARGNCRSPKVLAATHFHELFEMGILSELPELHFGHMEIRIDDSQRGQGGNSTAEGGNGENVVYLYNYRDGRSVKSYGTCCAALNGIEPAIVQRAEHLVRLAARGENLLSACAIMSEEEMEELKMAEEMARDFLQDDLAGETRQMLDRIAGAYS